MKRILVAIVISTACLAPDPALSAGPDFGLTDSLMLIFGRPRVEPGSQGHMISQWGYFEGPGMRAGDWALCRRQSRAA